MLMLAVVSEGGFTIKVIVEKRSPPSRSTIRSLTLCPHKAIPSPSSLSPHRPPRARHWIWLSRGHRRWIWRSRGPPPPGPAVPRLAYRAAIGGLLLVVAAPEPLSTAATCANPAEPPPTTATSQ
ncbi:Os11g0215901 [Oryza sativa Japonica Group]|uniref:Uncharacterized protein n=2 Tax=Oryza sativa subsp. japonica TaxID=39947 RepID=A0A8J8XCX9_ORYSJ|nr:hypothetical protein OsJ_33368 [Oryza sativa Japonica Group]BAT13216.1 Os11g0215901 [Oryza sativa Japonica Group]